MSEFVLYVFLNTLPITSYSFAPGTIIGPGSYIAREECQIDKIEMNEFGDITIECVTNNEDNIRQEFTE